MKFNSDGVRQWGTYYGGTDAENVYTCVTDHYGNSFIGGQTYSYNNIATPGACQTTFGGLQDGFLAKFNTAGLRQWGTYYGGTDIDYIISSATDDNGDIYITGITRSTTFIATSGSFQPVLDGPSDAFLVRFDSLGQRLWGTYYGGSHQEDGWSVSTDNPGHVFLAGDTYSPDNIASVGAFQPNLNGQSDGFLACFNHNGNRLWGTYFGGNFQDIIYCSACDQFGNVIVGGYTTSTTGLATIGAYQTILAGDYDGLIAKFTYSGQRSWATYYGSVGTDKVNSCSIGRNGIIYVSGWTLSTTGMASPGAYQENIHGMFDAIFAKFDSSGQQRIWGSYFGGFGIEQSEGIAVDTSSSYTQLYLSGYTTSSDYISTPGSHQLTLGGGSDSFLEKFRDCNSPDSAGFITGIQTICKPASGIIYVVPTILNATSYRWHVPPGATITSGQNTRSITVDFGIGAVSDSISVYGINDCGKGDSSYLYVQVHPRPVPVITGADSSCLGQTEIYYTSSGNLLYQWSHSPGGTIISGGSGTDTSITMQWTALGNQWIKVSYTDTNGCSALAPTLKNIVVSNGPSVSISIVASTNNVCTGTSVTFTATPTSPGTTPFYQWKVNGLNAGSNSQTFIYIPVNGDQINCILTSSLTVCISNNPATSNTIMMTVNPYLPVSISISPSQNPYCAGTTVNFTATPNNQGITPFYQWKVNGVNAGPNNPVYSYIPTNGDVVTCILNSSVPCPTGNPATSNSVTMVENTNVTVSVSIAPSQNSVCSGTTVSFLATPINQGTAPVYQWKVNGVNAGTNSTAFSYVPLNGDLVTCKLTSNAPCAAGNPATSNTVTM
ncbi:MAG: hypothetical protein WCL00_11640, partial [Bacteroidota bacterium]